MRTSIEIGMAARNEELCDSRLRHPRYAEPVTGSVTITQSRSHSVRERREIEIADHHRRNDDRERRPPQWLPPYGLQSATQCGALGRTDHLDTVERQKRRVEEPKNFDRFTDLAIFDEKTAVACHPGHHPRWMIDHRHPGKAIHVDPVGAVGNHLVDGRCLRAGNGRDSNGSRELCRSEGSSDRVADAVGEVLQYSLIDPRDGGRWETDHTILRSSFLIKRSKAAEWIGRIRDQNEPRIEDP
jgi:hypothetical protein